MSVLIDGRRRIAEGREAEIFEWGEGRVVRLFRRPRTPDALEREAAAMRAARAVVDAVPEVFDIVEVEGRKGLVLERIDGPDFITLLGSKPWLVWSAGTTLGRVHASLHTAIAPASLISLKERMRGLAERALPEQRQLAEGAVTVMERLPDGDRLCHGDFHPGNVLLSRRGPVVIDWPNVTRGDPAADFARTDLLLKMGDPPPGTPSLVKYMQGVGRKLIDRAYRRAYLGANPLHEGLIDRWQVVRMADRLVDDNIPEEREQLARMIRASAIWRSAMPTPQA